MKNSILVLLITIIWVVSGCAHNYRHNQPQAELKAERKAERKAANQAFVANLDDNKVTDKCDTPLSGSYRESCRSCQSKTTDECTDLACECRDKDNQWHWSIASRLSCPQDRYCNNNGVLQCGDC